MGTNVTEVIRIWNNEHMTASAELVTLEATLKTAYNAYIDSLCNYVERLKLFNEMRQNRFNSLVEKWERDNFSYRAAPPLENQAVKYLLDKDSTGRTTTSLVLVKACDSNKLLERKA